MARENLRQAETVQDIPRWPEIVRDSQRKPEIAQNRLRCHVICIYDRLKALMKHIRLLWFNIDKIVQSLLKLVTSAPVVRLVIFIKCIQKILINFGCCTHQAVLEIFHNKLPQCNIYYLQSLFDKFGFIKICIFGQFNYKRWRTFYYTYSQS